MKTRLQALQNFHASLNDDSCEAVLPTSSFRSTLWIIKFNTPVFLLFSFFTLPCKAICWWGEKKNHYGSRSASLETHFRMRYFLFFIFQAPLSSLEWVIKCFKLISIQLAIAQLLITTGSKKPVEATDIKHCQLLFLAHSLCDLKQEGTKSAWNCWESVSCVGGLRIGKAFGDEANAHNEYIQQLFNKPIKLFFCAREIYFVFFCRR